MKIGVQVAWDPLHLDAFLATARAADEAGVHSLWVNEGFGHDAFSGLAILARETRSVRLGTSIVNVYSRTPGALAQHFATIDELSGGRVIVGLGASAQGVIERFHAQPFISPRQRLSETATLLRQYWKKERFSHSGELFRIERALELGARPVQAAPPIYFATMAPPSVRETAATADGWLPTWIPNSRLQREIATLRQWSDAAGRPANAVSVRSPGSTVVANESELAAIRANQRATLAFFIARNGEFYYRQFVRQGLGAEADAIREAWNAGGREAALEALPVGLEAEFGFAGNLQSCLEHLRGQGAAGVDIHMVSLAPTARADAVNVLRTLAEA
ncbi:MAG: LLM class flavin-dependent oxidoreductase [Dehalococcoidia bacterium]